ncbi:biopolymer transport protein ExbB [Sphaerotilus sulfidivorans]|uniref:Biopolymer transport protein ExbB n=2 Tax=Sphaerotilus sulfidivorans TaxID=639200 RepID=A0ABV2IL94_9BURK|nr:MotA/TolQ/ExbB proton channel family protein [Sphaerotilus sulfidivorans]MCK6402315.1 MotA/TolQ/ExbB proton channel family protein [Sphaerotilus sulfidivorans]
MNTLAQIWSAGDAVSRAVALLLLAMSVSAWVVILWKAWVLTRVRADLARAVPAFWAAPDLQAGRERLATLDRERVLLPALEAALQRPEAGTLDAGSEDESRLTRRLRDALHRALAQLQSGQVLLASVGSTAPFVGLFGTVWGIYHALVGLSAGGSISLDRVTGPVGEALIMTAAGLAVAIPAVLAYNLFGKQVASCEADLEGWAHDLREMALQRARREA